MIKQLALCVPFLCSTIVSHNAHASNTDKQWDLIAYHEYNFNKLHGEFWKLSRLMDKYNRSNEFDKYDNAQDKLNKIFFDYLNSCTGLVKAHRNLGLPIPDVSGGLTASVCENWQPVSSKKRPEKHAPNIFIAAQKNAIDSIRKFVLSGVSLESKDSQNRTPLHHAALSNSIKSLEMLLDLGADIRAKDLNGNTALHHASQKGSIELVKLLVAGGADLESKNNKHQTPLNIAALYGRTEIQKYIKDTFLIKRRVHKDIVDARNN